MGTQTMGTQGVDSSGGGNKQSHLQSLARQNSLYSLTLDEVQNQLGDSGKPLSSMNLDELLKSVCVDVDNLGSGNQSSLQRQPSLSLTGTLSKKTVDEVWRDIQQGQNGNHEKMVGEKQLTLGEMTLEDFLVKAGVVAEGSLETSTNNGVANVESSSAQRFPPQEQWMQYQQPQFQHPPQNMINVYMPGQPISQPVPMAGSSMIEVPYGENQMPLPSPVMGALSDTQLSSRRRMGAEDHVDRSVERRQKRMIKNRESAARSRARKQAYTNELENKVSQLEAENEKLRKRKEFEKMLLSCASSTEPRYQLRRTSSSLF